MATTMITRAFTKVRLLALVGGLCLIACAQRNETPDYDASTRPVEAGSVDVAGQDAADGGDDAGQDAGELTEGTACAAANECRSGFCVDGVCCASACTGQCEACNVENKAGACVPVAGAPIGGRPACAGEGTCAGRCDGENALTCRYPLGAEAACGPAARCEDNVAVAQARCDGQGACAAPVRTACEAFACDGTTGACTECSASKPCAAGKWCQSGRCTAQLPPGGACLSNAACASGFCVSGICCDRACDGKCEACSAQGQCTFKPSTVACRPSQGGCDVAETCTGASGACPSDSFAAATTICRAASAACDVAESCSGSGPDCPADQFVAMSLVCRPAAGDCDVAEICTGTSAACPADGVKPAGQVCRGVANACDIADTCDGASTMCPADARKNMCSATSDGCCPEGCFLSTDADCTGACPGGQKACAGVCIPNSGCCNVNECAAMAGKVAACSQAYECVYTCAGGTQACSDGKCRSECVAPTVTEIGFEGGMYSATQAGSMLKAVAAEAKVVVKFSEAMNKPATQAAITLKGFTATYSWSADAKTLTITPNMLRLGTVSAGVRTYNNYGVTIGAAAEDVAGNKLVPASRDFVTLLQGTDNCPLQVEKSGAILDDNGTLQTSPCPSGSLLVGNPTMGTRNLEGYSFVSFDCSKVVKDIIVMNTGRLRLYKSDGGANFINLSERNYKTFDTTLLDSSGRSAGSFSTGAAAGYYEANVKDWIYAPVIDPSRAGAVQFSLTTNSAHNVFSCAADNSPTLDVTYLAY